MRRFPRDIRTTSALLLLAAFVLGGLLAPVVHRAYHGLVWAHLRTASTAACDHAHDAGFETVVPVLLDDDCLLCIRHLLHFDGSKAAPTALPDFAAYAPYAPERPASASLCFSLIRGPPRPA